MKAKKVHQKAKSGLVTSKRKKKDLSKITTEEFFEEYLDNATDDDGTNEENDNIDDGESSDNSENNLDPFNHKMSLMKLQETDPDFYKYLKENDKNLLKFDVSDDEDGDASSISKFDNRHILDENLEVASDESDFESENTAKDTSKIKITLRLLKTWQEKIQTDKSMASIKCVIEAFHAALESISGSTDASTVQYKVEGSAVFNGVVQLCVMYLPNAFEHFLGLNSKSHMESHSSKKFLKVRSILRLYLTDLFKILQNVASANIITVLLKHLHQMLFYTRSFPTLNKPMIKILLNLWSTGEETVRVVAFLCVLRITSYKGIILEMLLKNMYMKYVENTKFVSPNTLPGINFMRHSLVEIYMFDHNISYSYAFLYIRQLAIHLRNAMTLKKKENFQMVYNWQYINSLRFWTELVTKVKEKSILRSLLYPLVQIITGTIKVIPTAQYYPLRFHCVQMLITLSKETGTFIPILPFVLEVLDSYDFNKKHKAVSMKPIPLTCILRMSKSQLAENGFKDSIMDTIYQLILENAANESHTIYFPDVYIPCVIQLKAFLKKCHVATYCRNIKQLLDKIEENRKYIESERMKVTIDLKDMTKIKNWENRVMTNGTAIAKFYATWIKLHESRKLKLLTGNEEISEYNLPIKRKSKNQKLDELNMEESEEESELEFRIKGADSETKKPRNKPAKTKKKMKKTRDNKNDMKEDDLPREDTDIVQDINSDDWD